MSISPEQRLEELGYILPPALQLRSPVDAPLTKARRSGNRLFVSGHGPQNQDGSIAKPLGQVGADVTPEQANHAAHLTALSMIATLKRELGELDRVVAWNRVFGMVNCVPGFAGQTSIINFFSNTIIEVFGRDCGLATRSAVGMAGLPFGIPVEVEAECEVR